MSELGYIGDGVYVSTDGYQIWLAVNNHENKVIALDLDEMPNGIDYRNGIIISVLFASLVPLVYVAIKIDKVQPETVGVAAIGFIVGLLVYIYPGWENE